MKINFRQKPITADDSMPLDPPAVPNDNHKPLNGFKEKVNAGSPKQEIAEEKKFEDFIPYEEKSSTESKGTEEQEELKDEVNEINKEIASTGKNRSKVMKRGLTVDGLAHKVSNLLIDDKNK